MAERGLQVVIITGMSGAGRSTALHALEDVGFYCADNLPPSLAPELLRLLLEGEEIKRAAFGIDVRTGVFLVGVAASLAQLRTGGHDVCIVFLDASDEMLVRRYSETRRPHPLAPVGDVLGAIQGERERLGDLRAQATLVIDTTQLSVHDLKRRLVDAAGREPGRQGMVTRVVSFGFKYGIPVDADLVFDVRHVPNPYFVPDLRPLAGTDPRISKYVLEAPATQGMFNDVLQLLERAVPLYEQEGKAYLTIAIGCTGGRHRSVAVAAALAKALKAPREVVLVHRDVHRGAAAPPGAT